MYSPHLKGDHKDRPYETMDSINQTLKDKIVEVLRNIYDPEIPVNIYDLGLIYDVQVDPQNAVTLQFTLTSPNCPAAQSLPSEMETKIRSIAQVSDVKLDLVWEPAWGPDKMSEAARLQLGMF